MLYEVVDLKALIDFTIVSAIIFTVFSLNLPQFINTRLNIKGLRMLYTAINGLSIAGIFHLLFILIFLSIGETVYILATVYSLLRLIRTSILYVHLNRVSYVCDIFLIAGPMLITTLLIPFEFGALDISNKMFFFIFGELLVIVGFSRVVIRQIKLSFRRFVLSDDLKTFIFHSTILSVLGMTIHQIPRLLISHSYTVEFSAAFLFAYSMAFYVTTLSEPFNNITLQIMRKGSERELQEQSIIKLQWLFFWLSVAYLSVGFVIFDFLYSEKYPDSQFYFGWLCLGMACWGASFVANCKIANNNIFYVKYMAISIYALIIYPSFLFLDSTYLAKVFFAAFLGYSVILNVATRNRGFKNE